MYFLTLKDVTEHIDPWRTVVVAANEHNLGIRNSLRQAGDELVKYLYRFGGGDRLVINISGNHDRIGLFPCRDLNDLSQNVRLILI